MQHGYFSAQQMATVRKNSQTDKELYPNPLSGAHLYASPDGNSAILVTSVSHDGTVPSIFDDTVALGPVGDWIASFSVKGTARPPQYPVVVPRDQVADLISGMLTSEQLDAGREAAEAISTQLSETTSPAP